VDDSVAQDEVRRLKAELYELRSDQINSILLEVRKHGDTLAVLSTDVALVKERTEMLSPLNTRLVALEQWRWKVIGWCGAISTVAAFIGWLFPRTAH
jgi:hypothetical protein